MISISIILLIATIWSITNSSAGYCINRKWKITYLFTNAIFSSYLKILHLWRGSWFFIFCRYNILPMNSLLIRWSLSIKMIEILINFWYTYKTQTTFTYNTFRELLPMIDALRDDLARKVGSKWKDIFKLTISFADGSSARISAINAALKPYRPNYMHFWQLKTFWNEAKVGCIKALYFSRF